jgi:hypothetical protein
MTRLGRYLTPRAAALGLLLAFTLVIRIGVLVALQDNLRQDPDAYRNIADNLVWFRVYGMGTSRNQPPQPTAYRPPLYPLVLAKFASDDAGVVLWRVAVVHVILGLATVWLTWVVAGQICEPRGSSPRTIDDGETERQRDGEKESDAIWFRVAAGLLVACDPLLLHWSTLVMTETLAAFLTVLCMFALNRFATDRRPWNAGLAGGAIALAVLCRPTYLPWLALVGLTMLLLANTNPKRQRGTWFGAGLPTPPKGPTEGLPAAPEQETCGQPAGEVRRPAPNRLWRVWLWRGLNFATLMLIAAVVVSPWAIRNYSVFGKPIVSTTHGGYTLLLANNPWFYDYLRDDQSATAWKVTRENPPPITSDPSTWGPHDFATWWQFEKERQFGVYTGRWIRSPGTGNEDLPYHEISTEYRGTELDEDSLAYERAINTIRDRPALFAAACLYRLRQLWSPLPHRLTADESLARMAMRYAVAAWYVAVYLLAAVGIWKLRSKLLAPPWLWGVLLCLVFTAVHTFYWTNLRMRAPLMPFVALVAAYGVSELIRRVGPATRQRRAGPPK